MNKDNKEFRSVSRRDFLLGVGTVGGLMAASNGFCNVSVIWYGPEGPPGQAATANPNAMPLGTQVVEAEEQSRDPNNDDIIILGAVEDFAAPSITRYRHFRNGRFHLMRYPDGGFLALVQACSHQNCSVPWSPDEQRFPCPCHGSVYGEKGQLINGPATRPLDIYALTIIDGLIHVNKGTRIQRSNATPEDLVYP